MSVILLRSAIYYFTNALSVLIIIRALITWFPISRGSAFVRLLDALTAPILNPVRGLIYRIFPASRDLPLDFTPLAAIFLLEFARYALFYILSFVRF
ncbi:MAG: YggT family protein [Clostridiales bacterium]|jgi:YggT family protein|nr:YggT family protein [Clostridiales bacterium]